VVESIIRETQLSRIRSPFILVVLVAALALSAAARDLRIRIPKRSKPTPAQAYNQKGVSELKKGHIKEAKKLFYKAYLVDPDDAFTLNNLGYISELEGDVDRAQRYYELSAENASEAVVDKSTVKDVEGQPAMKVAGMAAEGPMVVNRLNVQAISMLEKDRPFEAEATLKKALVSQPNNPFTLNNLGYVMEEEGELQQAHDYYARAAAQGSREKIIVTVNKSWRGKPITEIAQRNARKIEKAMRNGQSVDEQVARLNLRGVAAMNRNDRQAAREFFQQAYKLDPTNAFALNNMGYLAELDGDRETAQLFYDKAHAADGSQQKIHLATRRDAEGHPLSVIADSNTAVVAARMQQAQQRKQRSGEAPALHERNGQVIQTQPRSNDQHDQDTPAAPTGSDTPRVIPDPSNMPPSTTPDVPK